MNDFVKQLYQEMAEDIAVFTEMGQPPINRLSGALKSMQQILLRLRTHITETNFKDEAAEISFFKYDKPKFVAEQIYLTEWTSIYIGRPDTELLKHYYQDELKRIHHFISRYGFLYQCYQTGASDLDSILFLRNAGPTGMILPEQPAPDTDFATAGDPLWAKFIAYDRLRNWLQQQLNGPENPGTILRWTGEAINLVEVAYGWWLTGQINDGNATITDIIRFLEQNLAVNIGVPNARWAQISARKNTSLTKYLDRMTESINQRIDQERGLRDRKRRAGRTN